MGWFMGMIPNESLIVYLLAVVTILSPANLLACLVSFFLFSFVSSLLIAPMDAIGLKILTIEALQPMYRMVIEWPLVAWTRFNNTVVCGGLAISLLGAVPLYLAGQVLYGPVYRWWSVRYGNATSDNAHVVTT